MKLEQQVSNLTLSKRLRELGVKQESLFYWQPSEYQMTVVHTPNRKKWSNENICSAFTVAELGEFVPKGEYVETFFHSLEIQLTCTFQRPIAEKDVFVGSNEADCRAKMLIYLIENDLITI